MKNCFIDIANGYLDKPLVENEQDELGKILPSLQKCEKQLLPQLRQ